MLVMSGSSRASHQYTRCIVSLDSGLSISWAPDPDGSYDHGRRHHQEEEAGFLDRLTRAAPAIEVLFDQLEEEGFAFTSPSEPDFEGAQHGATNSLEICEVQVRCTPGFSEPKLAALAERISKLTSK